MIKLKITCLMQRASDHKRAAREDVLAAERFSREMGLRLNRLFELDLSSTTYHQPYDDRSSYRTLIVVSEYRQKWVLSIILVSDGQYVIAAMADNENSELVTISKSYSQFLGKRMSQQQLRSVFQDFIGLLPADPDAVSKDIFIMLHEDHDVETVRSAKEEDVCQQA